MISKIAIILIFMHTSHVMVNRCAREDKSFVLLSRYLDIDVRKAIIGEGEIFNFALFVCFVMSTNEAFADTGREGEKRKRTVIL